jgi:hypothetical protein
MMRIYIEGYRNIYIQLKSQVYLQRMCARISGGGPTPTGKAFMPKG